MNIFFLKINGYGCYIEKDSREVKICNDKGI